MPFDDPNRPYYSKASQALEAAHRACFNAPGRDILGMSHGPFSGVNVALGIVHVLEEENKRLRMQIKALALRCSNVSEHVE
jgi:hypothetical protein